MLKAATFNWKSPHLFFLRTILHPPDQLTLIRICMPLCISMRCNEKYIITHTEKKIILTNMDCIEHCFRVFASCFLGKPHQTQLYTNFVHELFTVQIESLLSKDQRLSKISSLQISYTKCINMATFAWLRMKI